MRTEDWRGHKIHFMYINDEWCAELDDVCSALNVNAHYINKKDITSNEWGIFVNELAVYDLLLSSNIPEAAQFRRWSTNVLKKLRKCVGLEQYELLNMTNSEIQEDIDHILDTLYFCEDTGKVMRSVTVAGGDVEQIVFSD